MAQKLSLPILLLGCVALVPQSVWAAEGGSETASALREVNITSGSATGWIPSEELEMDALRTWGQYFTYLESGEYEAAHNMLTNEMKKQLPLARYRQEQEQFNDEAGALRQRKLLRLTWTKDSPEAPYPGVFAAIDATAQYERIDRQCGYLMLFQAPGGGQFKVSRVENAYIENAVATSIEQSKSPMELALIWRELSRNCPNYPAPPLPEADVSSIGYPTVEAAFDDLASQPGVVITTENNWTIATDEDAYTIWSFAPQDYPAYPAVVKRWITSLPEGSKMQMSIRCEATKEACDDLYETFAQMNGFGPSAE